MPPEDGAEMEHDGANDSTGSPSKAQQLLPLALTTSSKSTNGVLDSRSSSKQSTAADATSVKTEESEASTPSLSPPLTHNPPSAGAEDPLRLGDSGQADDSPANGSAYSEEETHADLRRTSPFKAPSASSHSAVANGDAEEDDGPLSLCVPKPGVENDSPHRGVNDAASTEKQARSTEELATSTESNPKPPAVKPLPALTPPASPKAIPEEAEACSGQPQEPEGNASQKRGESETSTPREPVPVPNPHPERDVPTEEEGFITTEKPSEEPESSLPAPAPQPPRPDKPYSCTLCGKAYASRSGLKVRVEALV